MSYYPKPDNHMRNTIKIDQSKYASKKKAIDASGLPAKKDFIALKAEVDKPDINKLVHVRTSLNNLIAKVDDLDVGKLKTVTVD